MSVLVRDRIGSAVQTLAVPCCIVLLGLVSDLRTSAQSICCGAT